VHLHLDVVAEETTTLCTCGSGQLARLFYFFLGTGNKVVGPICFECWPEKMALEVEQADMTPSRSTPTKKDKRRARTQERRIAEDIEGRRQPGSGNQDHAKGDVRKKGHLRVEAKYTRSKQFILKREELDKIHGECTGGEKPAFQIDFLNPTTNRREDAWVAIPYEDWKELLDAARKDQ